MSRWERMRSGAGWAGSKLGTIVLGGIGFVLVWVGWHLYIDHQVLHYLIQVRTQQEQAIAQMQAQQQQQAAQAQSQPQMSTPAPAPPAKGK